MSWVATYADDDYAIEADVVYEPETDDVLYPYPGHPGDPEVFQIIVAMKQHEEDGEMVEVDPDELTGPERDRIRDAAIAAYDCGYE